MMRGKLSFGQRAVLGAPYLWVVVFFLAPMALIAKISLSHPAQARPPYEPVFSLSDGLAGSLAKLQTLSLDAYRTFGEDRLYLDSYLTSLAIAGVSTALMLLVAYPFALAMARAPRRLRPILIGLAVAPFWTSFLIRVYAWIALLKDEGLINHALLPLYAALERQDPALREAAADLGASPAQVFWRVTLPLSLPGVVAGCLLVFIPAVGEFVIPDLLGGSETLMIGKTLWTDFFANRDWPAASAAAILLLVLLIGPLLVAERARLRAEGKPT